MHTPVLLQEAIEGLNIKKDGLYIDATAGEGGHLTEIARLGRKVLGIDQDEEQIKKLSVILGSPTLRRTTPESSLDSGRASLSLARMTNKIVLVQGNFKDIEKLAKENNFFPVDGILFDLGLSMYQLKKSGRGFSYKNLAEPLDMRISSAIESKASYLINNLEQNELYEIFARYGEEINSLAISKTVVRARSLKPIEKVGDLLQIIDEATGEKDNKTYARIFQALRISVNNELENLKKVLEGSLKILRKKGRLVVISFHSLEDRIVKQFINNNNLKQINKKLIKSTNRSNFERSAKMRVISYEKSI
ncbi:16S rRNA (cytosine(1402)-N(4))-methyltransferase [Candidatus Roizmanbacteria bacterium RIFCSPLOWO2_01_FULL_35_13]|uniref:Ribosomal RNA small subunit methyltransferase H n=1 Tax=Candidatus Roizmanbacteria bacterium RIFCSPLOWO2_01_FULL_35_13 TaxID=1802055 RepID=A0A1F7IHF9_9BACT|nr:MAG: 16S rRNA (cytosine(1402)-N(4))-methyltransferase [Candidatus Roizmanbacteria bacterium RIFCSPLOWO2_01_FULL_35_13]